MFRHDAPVLADHDALGVEGLWAPGTQGGSRRLPGGARSLAKPVCGGRR
jgi:hypothetical protein